MLTEGRGAGLKLIEVSNGVLDFTLNESKALDIAKLSHKGMNLSFISKNGLVSGNTDFSRAFNGGMLYTCGLDSVGAREGYDIHGTFHNIPAQITETAVNEDGIKITAEIYDTALFGKNLVLKRTIETKAFSNEVTVTDILTNNGYREEDYCLLYHINTGYPMLDESVIIDYDEEKIISRTTWAEKFKDAVKKFREPADNFEETCYFLKLKKPCVKIINLNRKKALTIEYSGDTLPNLVEWKSIASGDYALGIEPCTTFLDDYFKYNKLAAGESVAFIIILSARDL